MTRTIAAAHALVDPGASPVRDVTLTIEEGRVAEVGAAMTAPADTLLLPGLVNAHDHGRGFRTVAFGADDDALEPWLAGLVQTPPADPYTVAAVAFARMAGAGITAANHCHIPAGGDPVDEARAVARAAGDVGIRLAFAVPIVDRNRPVYGGPGAICGRYAPGDWALVRDLEGRAAPAAEQIAAADAIAAAIESDMVSVQYGPAGPQWVSDAALADIAARSAATGRRVHMHLLESPEQRAWADAAYPQGIVAHLAGLGLLSDRLTIAHGVQLRAAEIGALSAHGVTVSVNTSSNLRLRAGIAPLGGFLAEGLAVALGLDGMAFDDDEDMLRELRLAARLHAPRGVSGRGVAPERLLAGALAAGRRTIDGRAGYGPLVSGADADLVRLDLAAMAPDAVPGVADPMALALSQARRAHVRDVWCAGRPILKDGRVCGIDLPAAEAELTAAARAAAPHLAERAPAIARHRAHVREHYAEGGHVAAARRSPDGLDEEDRE